MIKPFPFLLNCNMPVFPPGSATKSKTCPIQTCARYFHQTSQLPLGSLCGYIYLRATSTPLDTLLTSYYLCPIQTCARYFHIQSPGTVLHSLTCFVPGQYNSEEFHTIIWVLYLGFIGLMGSLMANLGMTDTVLASYILHVY